MSSLFNPGFTAPTPNIFGPIGSHLSSRISVSSSPGSNYSIDHVNAEQQQVPLTQNHCFGAIGAQLSANLSSFNDFAASLKFNTSSSFLFNPNVCGSCERFTPENHCFDCSDSLCNQCLALHMRHFANKNHTIQRIIGPQNSFNRMPRLPSPCHLDAENRCNIHYEELRYVCESCKNLICQECSLRDHKEHRCTDIPQYVDQPMKTIQELMEIASAGKHQIKKCIDRVMKFSHYLDRDVHDILQRSRKNSIRATNGSINNAILRCEEKDHAFAETIEKFRQSKGAIYLDQSSSLRAALAGIAAVTDDLKRIRKVMNEFTTFDLAKALIDADNKIDHFMKQTSKLNPSPVNVQQYLISLERSKDQPQQQLVPDLEHLLQNNGTMLHPDIAALVAGTSHMSLMPNNTPKPGRRPIVRSNRSIYQNNGPQILLPTSFGAGLSTSTISPWSNGLSLGLPMVSNEHMNRLPNEATFQQGYVTFNAPQPQFAINMFNINDEPPAFGHCIFNYDGSVTAVRRNEPSLSFAYDGPLEGQLSRPWGVCVDKDGSIIIGDRRNNRIQVFYPDGTFKFTFGTKGTGDGELELPAGVTTDRLNRIIVADKDNHRVQVFSPSGRFILKFGTYGRDLGEFQYPWDVATNSNGHILVTDTRNHRIQMFTSMGHFITKYSFEAYYDRHLKSHITPRGICFTPEGDILVTDFENHRIMKMDGNLTTVKLVRGHEGEHEVNEFNRPSGLCCDDKGQVVIADSKNQRVLVYNSDFEFKWMLDLRRSLSELNNEKDRPSDVAILPDGRIVVLFETSPDTKDFPHPLKTFVQIY
ncbi:protein wech [Contarinia nasturtii]|uniref:protein wech n=1 Tax=Contarinia nasturtii TaxID=265458 RepID=UPI0012D396C6|nr:protein wech [Contarinia nasturtii]XP_031624102.1 protein wech [Contarinia nasturtii]XP_031624110.1 protein wech [Contarinia nasturtii]XP_031624119.1 protein wech [Contarinia nasturtii]